MPLQRLHAPTPHRNRETPFPDSACNHPPTRMIRIPGNGPSSGDRIR